MSSYQRMPDHSSASSSTSSSPPSFIAHIDLKAIASLATAVHSRTTTLDVICTVGPIPKLGAFNAVWSIDFADGTQWVLRVPIAGWTPMLERRLQSDIICMQLIQSRTNIPIPRLHDVSATPDNTIGRPYILMDRAKGTQLSKLWFDPLWFTDERRKTVFRSLVSVISQLRVFEFPTIGSLDYDPHTDTHIVVPLLPSFDNILNGDTETRGPYTTVHAYLLDGISRQISSAPSMDHKVSLSLLRLFAGALPDESLNGPPFVLSMPDFNYQNIFVDHDGKVTGLIDWDGVMIGPRQGGYAKYPSWITRDWDPLMYGYPKAKKESSVDEGNIETRHIGKNVAEEDTGEGEEEDAEEEGTDEEDNSQSATDSSQSNQIPSREELEEDSPSTLQTFREEYFAAFNDLDPVSAQYTRNSHVYEALEIAISAPYCRGHILDRLTRHVFGQEVEFAEVISSWSLEQGIRAGDWLKRL